ncbi:MAG: FAD-dependent monooxygenase [Rhizobiales bacterium]|nr:FAD-dependent monooxygenase [Hyphomicrobiales bacterium]
MNDLPFLIAGGGIAGLAASLALAGQGRSADVFERATSFEEAGAGLQISPNAVHCLRLLGAWDAVEPQCVIPSEIHVRDGRSGAIVQRIKLGKLFEARFGAPYLTAHRADLLHGLLQTAQATSGITLHTGKAVENAENSSNGARLNFMDGTAAEGVAVIAADGIRSRIRETTVADGEPSYRGHAVYRALLPFDKIPLAIAADCVTLWLYPGGHVVHYPVSNWRQFNIVAALDSPGPEEDGWGQPAGKAEVVNGFPHAADPLAGLLASVHAWMKFAASDRQPAQSWTDGHLALIGDAAHPSLPYLAQGAAMALEDACVLAKCVSINSGIATALKIYAQLRQPRTARIQREARRLGRIYHARGLTAQTRNAFLRCLGPDWILDRNRWIYDWKP